MPLVEKRYAEALVDLSVENGETDSYRDKLKMLAALYDSQQEFQWLLLTPEIGNEVKKETVVKLLGSQPEDKLANFIMLLIDKGRIKFLPGIFKEFDRLADLRKNVLTMTILSASPLTEMQIDLLKSKYRKEYNASAVNVEVQLDKSLIGGVKVIIGDRVIDGSVRGRLETLNKLIIEN